MALICGIDEAGRGCLFGSLFVAGVIGDEAMLQNLGVKDSKKLSKSARFKLESKILSSNVQYYIVSKSAKEIDSKGLSLCLKEAISEIMEHFAPICQHFVVDGNTCFGISIPPLKLESIIKGDDKVPQISCASILAKCAKDRQSKELSLIYPQYGLERNAGYGTKAHLEAIMRYGLTKEHRKSFHIKPIH